MLKGEVKGCCPHRGPHVYDNISFNPIQPGVLVHGSSPGGKISFTTKLVEPATLSTMVETAAITTMVEPAAISTMVEAAAMSTMVEAAAMSTIVEAAVISVEVKLNRRCISLVLYGQI